MNDLLNITAVDELAAIRDEIKQLEAREAQLRAFLLNGTDEDRDGKQYRAFILESKRESVDKNAMVAALGRDVVEPFLKSTAVRTLKLSKKEG